MDIIIVNGSSRIASFNQAFINYLLNTYPKQNIEFFDISLLPLFQDRENIVTQTVQDWRSAIDQSKALIITSPEYLSNIPAALKNALEWLNEGSSLANKKVLPIILTPQKPRGEKALQCLLWSLQSLQADILPSLSLYHANFTSVNESLLPNTETLEILDACFENLS